MTCSAKQVCAQGRTWVLCSGREAAGRPSWARPPLPVQYNQVSLEQMDKGGQDGQEDTPSALALHFKLRKLFLGASQSTRPWDHWTTGKGSFTLSTNRTPLVCFYMLAKFNRSCKGRTWGNQGSIQRFVKRLPVWPWKSTSSVTSIQLERGMFVQHVRVTEFIPGIPSWQMGNRKRWDNQDFECSAQVILFMISQVSTSLKSVRVCIYLPYFKLSLTRKKNI